MIELKTAHNPRELAELIASSLPNQAPPNPGSTTDRIGKLVKQAKEQEQLDRPRWDELDTVNFQTLDEDNDWSEV